MHETELARVPLFADLTKRELQRIAATAREQHYEPGATLVTQDSPGAGFFILISGKVRVTQRLPDGTAREVSVLQAGDTLGEMALLDDLPRSSTATAAEPTTALVLTSWEFRAVLREEPDITLKLLAALSRRLRQVEQGPH
jgi:CRP/FNR family transcriptional regulator, cyclic AMP receptor protein